MAIAVRHIESGARTTPRGFDGCNGDSRPTQTAVEQQLSDQSAHRVADDDRRHRAGIGRTRRSGRSLAANPIPGSAGQSGACTTWPAARYLSIQPRQLSADNHSPWISTIGAVTFDIVSSVGR